MIDIDALKNKLLLMAINGQLVEQNELEENANTFLTKIVGSSESDDFICDEEIPYTVPSNWRVCKFGQVVDFYLGKTPARGNKRYWENGVYPWISISDITNNGFIYDTTEKVSQEAYDECFSNGITKKGTLIMSFKLSIGKVAILGMDSFHNEAIISIFPKYDEDNIFRDYLFWMLPVISSNTDSHGAIKGNTLNKKSLSGMIVPIPPLAEQKRIVNKLNELYLAIEKINELQTKFLSDKIILKNKIIDAGIRGKLTEQLSSDGSAEEVFVAIQTEKVELIKEKKIKKEKALPEILDNEIPFIIPENWKWVRLGDLCSKISSGNTPAGGAKGGAYVDEGYCFFREQNIYNDGIHEEGMVYISEELLNSRPNSTVLPKDILLNITGGSIGRCALVPEDFTKGSINQHILIIRTIDPRIRFYVHKCLCSPYYQKLIMGNVVGDKDGFSAGRCKNTLIPLPPISEQERIVERIGSMLATIE